MTLSEKTPSKTVMDDEKTPRYRATTSDVGAAILTGAAASSDLDPNSAVSRRILRKIDGYLLPVLMVTYLIQALDKSCISYAALWGMREDAGLVGDQYSWLTTIFYLGYMASEMPSNYIFQKFDIARVCGITIVLWGSVLLCMAAADDFAGLMTTRFFLGALEAGVSPCFVLMTAMFYRRDEQPFRTAIWFSMNGLAQIVGGLVGYAIGFIDDAGLPAWKFPFVIFGSITVAWGLFFIWATPSNPTRARWLTAEEKEIAVLRLAENETGIDNKEWKWYHVREALCDPLLYLLNLFMIAKNIPNGGVSAFGPLIINGFGFTDFESTLLGIPSGACQILALWIGGYLSGRFRNIRHFLMIGGILIAILGSALIYALPTSNIIGRLMGYYLLVGYSVAFVQGLSLTQANVAGRTKKSIFTGTVFVSYCVGNLIGPQLFFESEYPRYDSGFISMLVCFAAQVLLVAAMYVLLRRENSRRDRIAAENASAAATESQEDLTQGLTDLTDRENLRFRYAL